MKKEKADLLQGTLELLVLRLLRSGRLNGWDTSCSASGSSPARCSPSRRGRSTRRCTGLKSAGWSRPSGASLKQPAGEVLLADRRRAKAVGRPAGDVGALHGGRGGNSPKGVGEGCRDCRQADSAAAPRRNGSRAG